MLEFLKHKLSGKTIAILGFGREGQSSYILLRKVFPGQEIMIADRNEDVINHPLLAGDGNLRFFTGENYLEALEHCDLLMKSPGVRINHLEPAFPAAKVISQTSLFLERYGRQIIGVTGTKGKSTTSSLISHILQISQTDTCLVGNIGSPAFHFTDRIKDDTLIVFELSSHQLEYVNASPHIAILLNLFQEHLDAYPSYEAYQQSKLNITRFQKQGDFLIFNSSDELIPHRISELRGIATEFPFSLTERNQPGVYIQDNTIFFSDGKTDAAIWKIEQKRYLKGEHNLKNIMAAVAACSLAGVNAEAIREGILTFKGLEHRLEYIGEHNLIHFYNDSIATIPEATIEAVRSVPRVDTLILGGFDRGIDYDGLADFLVSSEVRTLVLLGDAGRRIGECMKKHSPYPQKLFYINRFDALKEIVFRVTRPGYSCLLSPAAASYDEFSNFEERGKRYREIVRS